jgi:peptide-methionine (R)-S-oxide reductase
MERRGWLQGVFASVALGVLPGRSGAAQPAQANAKIEELQKNWKLLLADTFSPPPPAPPLKLAKEEWRKRLDRMQYNVLREEGTERPGSSPLNAEKRNGVFVCAGCDLPLFTSAMKYESGTGWPSFFTAIPGALGTKKDFGLLLPRVEYHCIRCEGHHGHVFDDGPPPTNQRYCNNGVALKFVPKTAKA